MTATETKTTAKTARPKAALKGQWKVILFNCNCHSFEEVVDQLILAIRCDQATAWMYANMIHTLGSAVVFTGSKEKCEEVAKTLAAIGLIVTVRQ